MIPVSLEPLAIKIFASGAIRIADPLAGGFTLHAHKYLPPHARKAPIYIETSVFPQTVVEEVAERMEALLMRDDVDLIGIDEVVGVPNAGNPFAEALARRMGKKLGVLDKADLVAKWDRLRRDVEKMRRPWHPLILRGPRVLLVENIITTGDSVCMTTAAQILPGNRVADVASVFDWRGSAAERLQEAPFKMNIHSLFPLPDLFEFYRERGRISDEVNNLVNYFSLYLKGIRR